MRKPSFLISHFSFLIALTALCTSCNLFIDDELEEEKASVPVHTGYGYDEPVHEQSTYYDITYQYNSNVRQLDEQAQRYLLEVHVDSTGTVGWLDFDLDMPREMRPVRGEIIMSGITDKFPRGFAHEVVAAAEMNGVYRMVTCGADLEEIFKTIDMDVDLGGVLQEKGVDLKLAPTTRFGETEDVSIDKPYPYQHGILINLPINIHTFKVDANTQIRLTGNIKTDPRETYYGGQISLHARCVKIDDDLRIPFSVYVRDDWHVTGNIEVTGSANLNFNLYHKSDFIPEGVAVAQIGPVTLKACLGLDINFKANFTGGFNVLFNYGGIAVHEFGVEDVLNPFSNMGATVPNALKNTAKDFVYDKKRNYCNFVLQDGSVSAALEFITSGGIGLYTGDFSLRGTVGVKLEASTTSPKEYAYGQSIQNNPGFRLTPDIGIGAMLTRAKNVKDMFYKIVQGSAYVESAIIAIIAYFFVDDAEDYNSWIALSADLQKISASLASSVSADGGQQYKAGPYYFSKFFPEYALHLVDIKYYPWMDERDWQSFPEQNVWGSGAMCQKFSYTLNSPGCLVESKIPMFAPLIKQYTPCLLIKDPPPSDKFRKLVFCKDKIVKAGFDEVISYNVPLSELPQDARLVAVPGYFAGDIDDKNVFPDERMQDVMDGLKGTEYKGADGNYHPVWSNFYFHKEQNINTTAPPSIRIDYIKWVNTEPCPPDFNYDLYRTFQVVYRVSDPSRADKFGLKVSNYVDQRDEKSLHTLQGKLIDDKNHQYVANFYQYGFNSDEELRIIPYSERGLIGSDAKASVLFKGTQFHSKFNDGYTYILHDDGEWEETDIDIPLIE